MNKKERRFLDSIQDWIAECDVDNRGICFEFFDTDANDLMVLCRSFIDTQSKGKSI